MKKILRAMNYQYFKNIGETFELPSLTVPNEAISVQQMLISHMKGLPLPRSKNAYFSKNPDYDDVDNFTSRDFDMVDAFKEKEYFDDLLRGAKRVDGKEPVDDKGGNKANDQDTSLSPEKQQKEGAIPTPAE